MDDKVIKIHQSIFLNRYNNIIVPENILNKAEQLRKNCNCFIFLFLISTGHNIFVKKKNCVPHRSFYVLVFVG